MELNIEGCDFDVLNWVLIGNHSTRYFHIISTIYPFMSRGFTKPFESYPPLENIHNSYTRTYPRSLIFYCSEDSNLQQLGPIKFRHEYPELCSIDNLKVDPNIGRTGEK